MTIFATSAQPNVFQCWILTELQMNAPICLVERFRFISTKSTLLAAVGWKQQDTHTQLVVPKLRLLGCLNSQYSPGYNLVTTQNRLPKHRIMLAGRESRWLLKRVIAGRTRNPLLETAFRVWSLEAGEVYVCCCSLNGEGVGFDGICMHLGHWWSSHFICLRALERGSKYKEALTPHFTEVIKIRVISTQSIRTSWTSHKRLKPEVIWHENLSMRKVTDLVGGKSSLVDLFILLIPKNA